MMKKSKPIEVETANKGSSSLNDATLLVKPFRTVLKVVFELFTEKVVVRYLGGRIRRRIDRCFDGVAAGDRRGVYVVAGR